MKIKRSKQYLESLENIMDFIAKDSVNRAISFYTQLDKSILSLTNTPYKCRKSFYYSDYNIRDLIYKGYTIPYLIDDDTIVILDIFKWINK